MTHGRTTARLILSIVVAIVATVALTAGMASTAMAQNPEAECAAEGLEYLDKIDEINGSGDYTSDEGNAYTVTVTDNPNPTPDSYTLDPDPAASGYYPGYTNITEVAKFGEGGGLSHITICGELGGETPVTPAETPVTPGETPVTPVDELPEVGTGTTGSRDAGLRAVALLAAAVALFGAAAVMTRRQTQ
jgi:hypothetical protein